MFKGMYGKKWAYIFIGSISVLGIIVGLVKQEYELAKGGLFLLGITLFMAWGRTLI